LVNADVFKTFAGMNSSKSIKEFNRLDSFKQPLTKYNRKQRSTYKHNEVIAQAMGLSFGKLARYEIYYHYIKFYSQKF
jgi:hypothetical protein